jgi:hypothetical protein
MERRKKKLSNETFDRSHSPQLALALDLVNKSTASPTRVDGIRSLLSRKIDSPDRHVRH